MTKPIVHEFPIADTTHSAPLRRYATAVLTHMAETLRARPSLRPDEEATLRLIESELAERR
jgi:hypothetical protein